MDLSIVISLYNENESLRELTEWIDRAIAQSNIAGIEYEVLMIDDGSDDGSWETIKELSSVNPHIRAYSFRRNYGKSAALQTGLRPGVRLEESPPRQHFNKEHTFKNIQLHRPQGHRAEAARHELRTQSLQRRRSERNRSLR